ncbi:hypothetical protein [Shewanella baltica]|uniref:hypothetical protein n=1 Tax=Shewanella baltica TaxID=62322 RepID=UPI0039B01145
MSFFDELKQVMLEGNDPETIVIATDDFCCTRSSNRASFAFENVFGAYRYPVSLNFLPSGAVNVVVGGGRSRCHANDIFIIEDDSANDNPTLEHLKFLVVAGGLNFNVSASVHSQLKEHPEFKQQKSMVEYQSQNL